MSLPHFSSLFRGFLFEAKTYGRQGLVDDNTVTDEGTKEGACVPVGSGFVVEGSPVREVQGSADQHCDVTQPPDELRSLFSSFIHFQEIVQGRWKARPVDGHTEQGGGHRRREKRGEEGKGEKVKKVD